MYSTKEVQTYLIYIFHQVQQQNDYKNMNTKIEPHFDKIVSYH
jgi:hypothetical protein